MCPTLLFACTMFKNIESVWQVIGNFQKKESKVKDIDLEKLARLVFKIDWRGIVTKSIDEVVDKPENRETLELFVILIWTTGFSALFLVSYLTIVFAGVLNILFTK